LVPLQGRAGVSVPSDGMPRCSTCVQAECWQVLYAGVRLHLIPLLQSMSPEKCKHMLQTCSCFLVKHLILVVMILVFRRHVRKHSCTGQAHFCCAAGAWADLTGALRHNVPEPVVMTGCAGVRLVYTAFVCHSVHPDRLRSRSGLPAGGCQELTRTPTPPAAPPSVPLLIFLPWVVSGLATWARGRPCIIYGDFPQAVCVIVTLPALQCSLCDLTR
jgi:hypothetical protein